jgi:5-methylcytosine-specific restriction endonuclease McrA
LALIAVRNQEGELNPDAWKELGPGRDAIINRSLNHTFTPEDYAKIGRGLESLAPRPRIAAWKYLRNLYPGDLLYQRLVGNYSNQLLNAIDDIGTDTPLRVLSSGYTYLRDQRVRDRVLQRSRGICEYCESPGFLKEDSTRYLESHHVIALANEGEDRDTNVIALCPNDHREAHFGARRLQMEHEMIAKLSVFTARP